MGFDLNITCSLFLCKDTGKPFYYGINKISDTKGQSAYLEKIYDLSTIVVPEQYRRFLVMRGHFLHMYTNYFNEHDIYSCDVYDFVEKFPEWSSLAANENYAEYLEDWHEEDHNMFREALEWLGTSLGDFRVTWSY
jgi:hypothetical protein